MWLKKLNIFGRQKVRKGSVDVVFFKQTVKKSDFGLVF